MNIAIVFASGSGVRMGAGIPKQFLEVEGKPILIHTLKLFQLHRRIDKIYLSVLEDYIPYAESLIEEFRITKVAGVMAGGQTAQESIYIALKKAAEENDPDSIVLLHDGVRPYVSYEVISNNIRCVKEHGNAITCTPCYETVMLSSDGHMVDQVPSRSETFAAQAPQSFYLKDILRYHEMIRATENGYEGMVDSCTMIKNLGIEAHMVPGNRGNIKVTTPEDVYMLRALLHYKDNEQIFGLGLTNRVNHKISRAIDRE